MEQKPVEMQVIRPPASTRRPDSAVEVEVLRRLLLEPQPIVVRRVLQELRRLLEHVFSLRAVVLLRTECVLDVVLDGRVATRIAPPEQPATTAGLARA